jgi:predicted nuclease of predicted toxin-antitoxin system
VKLVLDERYAPAIAVQLRGRGYDVVAVAQSHDLRELPDEDLLRWAEQARRVVVTEDASDFLTLHRAYLERGDTRCALTPGPPA